MNDKVLKADVIINQPLEKNQLITKLDYLKEISSAKGYSVGIIQASSYNIEILSDWIKEVDKSLRFNILNITKLNKRISKPILLNNIINKYSDEMKSNCFYLLISLLLGLLLSFTFYPISVFPFIISIGVFSLILKKYNNNLVLFLHGLLFGYGFFVIQTYWIPFSIYKANINLEWAVPILSILIPIPFAAVIGVLAMCSKFVRYNNILYSINFTFLWVIFEYLRSEMFFPFAWGLLGYSSISMPWFKNILSFIGSYGASFVIVLFSTSLFTRSKLYILFNIILFMYFSVVGEIRKEDSKFQSYGNEKINIRIVQPNIQKFHFGNSEKQSYIFKKISRLTLSKDFGNINYVFWPESSFPYTIFKDTNWFKVLQHFVPNHDGKPSALIFGTDRVEHVDEKLLSYNSLIAINKTGEVLGVYDKRILIPFGEYMPIKVTNNIINKLANSPGIEDFSVGKKRNIINLDDHVSFLPLICSESTLDKKHLLLDDFHKYNFILNITNDAWFENTFGPYQHFLISSVIAVEYGLPVIRVANTGLSGIINAYGDIIKVSQINTEAVIDDVIPPKLKNPTLFYKIHEFIIPTIFTLYVLFLALIYIYRFNLREKAVDLNE